MPHYQLIHCHQVTPSVLTHKALEKGTPEAHDYHEMIFLMDGLYSVFVDEKKHQLRPGQAILLAAGQPHLAQTVRDGATNLFVLQWQGDFPHDGNFLIVQEDSNGILRHSLTWLHGLNFDTERMALERDSLLTALLEHLRHRQELEQERTDKDHIAAIYRFIQTTCHYQISMELLSSRSGIAVCQPWHESSEPATANHPCNFYNAFVLRPPPDSLVPPATICR